MRVRGCLPFFHHYGKWREMFPGLGHASSFQVRTCEKCGRQKKRYSA